MVAGSRPDHLASLNQHNSYQQPQTGDHFNQPQPNNSHQANKQEFSQDYHRDDDSRMMLSESKYFPGHPSLAAPFTPAFGRKDLFTQRKQREFIPENKKDESYWDRRRRNNEAAKRSREKRRLNDMLLESRVLELTKDNHILRAQLNAIFEKYGIKGENMISMDQVLATLPTNDQVLNFTKKRLSPLGPPLGSPAPSTLSFQSLNSPLNNNSIGGSNGLMGRNRSPSPCSPSRSSSYRSRTPSPHQQHSLPQHHLLVGGGPPSSHLAAAAVAAAAGHHYRHNNNNNNNNNNNSENHSRYTPSSGSASPPPIPNSSGIYATDLRTYAETGHMYTTAAVRRSFSPSPTSNIQHQLLQRQQSSPAGSMHLSHHPNLTHSGHELSHHRHLARPLPASESSEPVSPPLLRHSAGINNNVGCYDDDQNDDKDSGLALNLSTDRAGSDGRSSISGSPPTLPSTGSVGAGMMNGDREGSSSDGDESGCYPRSPDGDMNHCGMNNGSSGNTNGQASSSSSSNLPHKLRFKTVPASGPVGTVEKEAVNSLLSLHQIAMIKREPVDHINHWMERMEMPPMPATSAAQHNPHNNSGPGPAHSHHPGGFFASLLPPSGHRVTGASEEDKAPANLLTTITSASLSSSASLSRVCTSNAPMSGSDSPPSPPSPPPPPMSGDESRDMEPICKRPRNENLTDEVARLTSEVATLKNILVNRMKEERNDEHDE